MPTRMERIAEMMQHSFDREGSFSFRCRECGKCCRDREDIMLTPYDLNRIARYLDIPVGQVIQENCVWYVGQSSRLPVVVMDMKGPEKTCPFLKDRKCRIHAAKPTVCALFPLGRVGTDEKDASVRYILQDVGCGARDETHTVREWLKGYGLEESEDWFREWQEVIIPLAERMKGYGPAMTERIQNMIGKGLLGALYVNYDSGREFMPQFHENARRANQLLDTIDETLRQFGKR